MSHELFANRPVEILIAVAPCEALKLLSQALSQEGYNVRHVPSGHLALRTVEAAPPDLVLLDVELPDVSGYEVCQQLKAAPQTAATLVMFISAQQASIDKARVFQVGGVDYLTQPLHVDELLLRVHNQLTLSYAARPGHQLNAAIEQRVQKRAHQWQAVNQALTAELREQQQVGQRLRDSEEKLRQIAGHIQEVLWLIDIDPERWSKTDISYVSPAFEEIWGQPRQNLYDNNHFWLETIHPDDRDRVAAASDQLLCEGIYDEDYRIVRPDGTVRWIRDRGFPIHDQFGRVYRIAGLAEDVTAQVIAHQECDHCFKLSLDLLFIADSQGRLKRVNPAWQDILGYSQTELVDLDWADIIHPDELSLVQGALTMLEQGSEVSEVEMQCRHRNGSYVWVAWNAVPLLQEHLIYGTGRDVSERKTSEARLIYETLHDALTGLANRPCFLQRLELAIKKQRRFPKNHFAVLFIDLDGFKSVNDTLGHGVGDELLIRIARILLQSVREVDTVARLGGDEFTVLLEDCQQPREVLEIAERIQKNLEPALNIQHHEIFTSASIGIVVGKPQYQQPAEILRDADSAMYRAKANGKARYAVFDEAMYTDTVYQAGLESSLHHAIANQELELHYQPIVSLGKDITIEGLEVLVRWRHPQKGLIPASDFIPMAEETGLVAAIGEWVLQEACMQFCLWQQLQPKFRHLYLSINISGQQLREPSLLQTLTRMLAETHTPAHCLRFEITESSLIHNTRMAAELLAQIRNLGIHISLDDFGTGFSALSYLHQLPIDTIKIDRSFVELLQAGDRERSIITAILGLSQTLGLATVAEGIETIAQLEALRELDCTAGQGFYFSPPMTSTQLEDWLTGNCQDCSTYSLCVIDCPQVHQV